MKFDITRLDVERLIKAAYTYATNGNTTSMNFDFPLGEIKIDQYKEDEMILAVSQLKTGESLSIERYHDQLLNLQFANESNNCITLDTQYYDQLHGRYRLFEALIYNFEASEIKILKSHHSRYAYVAFEEDRKKERGRIYDFQQLLRKKISVKGFCNKHWVLDAEDIIFFKIKMNKRRLTA